MEREEGVVKVEDVMILTPRGIVTQKMHKN